MTMNNSSENPIDVQDLAELDDPIFQKKLYDFIVVMRSMPWVHLIREEITREQIHEMVRAVIGPDENPAPAEAEEQSFQMPAEDKVILTFSHLKEGDDYIRYTIRKDEKGFHHIDSEEVSHIIGEDQKPAVITTTPKRIDIHGPMDLEAYNAWMSNVLWNNYYMKANLAERAWMMGD